MNTGPDVTYHKKISRAHRMIFNATWPPPSPYTHKHKAGDPNIRVTASKCSSGSKASVSFPNDSFLPLHRSLYFMAARASVALEVLSSVASSPKCSGDCTSFLEFEERRSISPSPWTNSNFPTKIVYWSSVTSCNLYYFNPRFSGVGIFFYPCLSVRPGVCFHGIGRERLNRISWNLVALQHICCFYYVTAFRRWGHSILPSVRQEVVSVQ